ncbi:hypothetical protein NSQ62_07820 [Solibacillus sp. FSL H8-0523]|uniref:hypothetical protein n=1 Tax=Solibacillus sp. FSL H8-0523 TaxID=2954511 RepID=UPI003100EAE0
MTEKNTTSKTTGRKTAASKSVDIPTENQVNNSIEKTIKQPKVPLTANNKITVMNNTTGRYGYIGRSGYSFELEEYGDTAQIPFGELQAMRSSSQKRHIEDAFIIILNEDAVAELNYTKLYESVLDKHSVEELFSNPQRLEETLPKMPVVMRETVISIAKQKYMNRTLFDIRIIEIIEKCLDVKIIE